MSRGRPSTLPHPNAGAVSEPSPIDGTPDCPDGLLATAKAKWLELAPLLAAAGTITKLDADALKRYCVIFARLEKANVRIQREGEVKKGKDRGGAFQNPWLFVANKCVEQLEILDKRLGISLLSRERLGIKKAVGRKPVASRDRSAGPKENAG